MAGGRPSKLTPQLQDDLCSFIADGHTQAAACAAVGIAVESFHLWRRKGEASTSGRYFQFSQAFKEADALWEQSHLDNIKAAATQPSYATKTVIKELPNGNVIRETTKTESAPLWTASAWLLERRLPDTYGRRVVQHDGKIDTGPAGTVKVELVAPKEQPNVHMPEVIAGTEDV